MKYLNHTPLYFIKLLSYTGNNRLEFFCTKDVEVTLFYATMFIFIETLGKHSKRELNQGDLGNQLSLFLSQGGRNENDCFG